MDEQRNTTDNRTLIGASVSIVVSVLLSRLTIASLFFNLPILLFVPKIRETAKAVLSVAMVMVLVAALTLFEYRDFLSAENYGILFFALYFQLVSSVVAVIWTALRDFSDSVLRKIVICSYPVAIVGIVFAWVLGLPVSEPSVEGFKQSVIAVLNPEALGISINAESFADMFIMVLKLIIVPMGMVFGGLPVLVSELIVKKYDENWQNGFANMKMPDSFIWIFMAAWFAVIFTSVKALPELVVIIAWNVALGLSLHYYLGGFSIVMARLRRKTPLITAGRVFLPIILLSILPGANAVVLAGLTILGALETWVKLR